MKRKIKIDSKVIARAALIAALYFVLTAFLPAISYGPLQIRISEALTLLPALMPVSATIGLFVGCFLANLYGMVVSITGIYDVIFGFSCNTNSCAAYNQNKEKAFFTSAHYYSKCCGCISLYMAIFYRQLEN